MKQVGPEMDQRLRDQLAFWQAAGPALAIGWWNEDASPHAPLRDRFTETIELVGGLERVRYRPAALTAERLAEYWRSPPQLNDPSGLDQMATECDQNGEQLAIELNESSHVNLFVEAERRIVG